MSAPAYVTPLAQEVAHAHTLLDDAKVPREIPEGREAGLIERVSWLVAEVQRLQKLTSTGSAADSTVTP